MEATSGTGRFPPPGGDHRISRLLGANPPRCLAFSATVHHRGDCVSAVAAWDGWIVGRGWAECRGDHGRPAARPGPATGEGCGILYPLTRRAPGQRWGANFAVEIVLGVGLATGRANGESRPRRENGRGPKTRNRNEKHRSVRAFRRTWRRWMADRLSGPRGTVEWEPESVMEGKGAKAKGRLRGRVFTHYRWTFPLAQSVEAGEGRTSPPKSSWPRAQHARHATRWRLNGGALGPQRPGRTADRTVNSGATVHGRQGRNGGAFKDHVRRELGVERAYRVPQGSRCGAGFCGACKRKAEGRLPPVVPECVIAGHDCRIQRSKAEGSA